MQDWLMKFLMQFVATDVAAIPLAVIATAHFVVWLVDRIDAKLKDTKWPLDSDSRYILSNILAFMVPGLAYGIIVKFSPEWTFDINKLVLAGLVGFWVSQGIHKRATSKDKKMLGVVEQAKQDWLISQGRDPKTGVPLQ